MHTFIELLIGFYHSKPNKTGAEIKIIIFGTGHFHTRRCDGLSSDGDKDVHCVCTHGLLVGTHGNFKPNMYRVQIKE